MKNHLTGSFSSVRDMAAFSNGLQQCINEVRPEGIWCGDNLFAFNRNLSFLDDEKFMSAVGRHCTMNVERGITWRQHTLAWAARSCMFIEGDFVECACYRGTSALIVSDYVDLPKTNKKYFLYDLFEHASTDPHHAMPEHSADLYEGVKKRFSGLDNVVITRGRVPEILQEVAPERVAFLHLNMNSAEPELAALEFFWERMSPGAVVVLDDYGWLYYRAQKLAEDPFFVARGLSVLEMPTGQGLVVKR